MSLELNTRADITLDAYRRVAWEKQPRCALVLVRCRSMDAGAPRPSCICSTPIPASRSMASPAAMVSMPTSAMNGEARRTPCAAPPRSAAVAFGPAAPERVARGIVLVAAGQFHRRSCGGDAGLGRAGAADCWTAATCPQVSIAGQGGAGEILWMAPLIIELAEKFSLGEKDALSLINGSPAASALIADAAIAMRRRLDLAERVFALSAEAIKAPLEAYDAGIRRSVGRSL